MRIQNTKDPISVGALPGQSSSNQLDDGMKNYSSTTIKRDQFPEGHEPSQLFDRDALRRANMKELESLQKALHTLGDVACSMTSQPRFFDSETREYNATGAVLVKLVEAFGVWETRVANVAAASQPETPDEVKDRAYCLLSYVAGYPDDLAEFSLIARQAVDDQYSAKCREASQ